MAGNLAININNIAQEAIVDYFRSCSTTLRSTWSVRERMRAIDLIYQREADFTEEQLRARTANRAGDPTKYQNITVPVVLPAVETAVTYQSSVFLTGIPLFGVSASAQYMDAALQMETIIDDQATKGGWTRQLQLFFRDGFKYNLGAVEVDWEVKKTWIPQTDLAKSTDRGVPTEIVWEGNNIKRLDPYNIIFDPRYIPAEISTRGEFAGYSELCSRVELIQYLQNLDFKMNYRKALECGFPSAGTGSFDDYYLPSINPAALIESNLFSTFNWFQWAGVANKRGGGEQFKNAYIKTVLYARIVPSDFGIPSPNPKQPQIWKFVIINNQVVVLAERQTNAHNLIPILFCQPLEDGLGYQTKSLAQNSAPFQDVSTALMNSAIAARRRAVSDRGIYDPSKIDAKHINNDSPTAKIPLKPAAYGRSPGEAYYPIPFRDEQSQQSMSDISSVLRFNEMVTGQNQAQQGQFVKGNKTLREYEDVMGNAAGRSQNTSILLESQFFTPLKELLKLNILQYQKASQVYSRETEQTVVVDPVLLRKAVLTFKISDGLTPASKQMNTDSFQAACQTLASVPQLADAYNLGPMFSYLFKQQRADVAPFEKSQEQLAYENAVNQWRGAVAQLTEAIKGMKDNPMSPEDMQKALPPQPTPEQFGFNPGAGQAPKPAVPIMQQFAAGQPQ